MLSSGMLCHAVLVRTDVSEELSATFIRVTRIGELGTLAVTSNRRMLPHGVTSQKTPFFTVYTSSPQYVFMVLCLISYSDNSTFTYKSIILHCWIRGVHIGDWSILPSELYMLIWKNLMFWRNIPPLPSRAKLQAGRKQNKLCVQNQVWNTQAQVRRELW
jgi:hypothetical protein